VNRTLAVLAFSSVLVIAQTPTGQVLGVVTDASGAGVPLAQIAVTSLTTNQSQSVVADDRGSYLIRGVLPGRYKLSARRDGFRSSEVREFEVTTLENVRLDVQLTVGDLSQTITVSSEAVQVDTRSASAGLLVDDRRVRDLPLNGRNVVDLAALTPGVQSTSTTIKADYSQQQIVVNGGRQTSVNFLLDGASTQFFHRGQGLTLPPPDAVQEFRLVTSGVPAEYGRGFAVLSAVTRSGTNDFHGSAWEFLRNDDFDARSFFATQVPKLRFNQFGATGGGPIHKNKTFFFASYEGLRIRQDVVSSSTFVPDSAQRSGNFSALTKKIINPTTKVPFAGNIVPRSDMDPVALKLLTTYVPSANLPNGQYVAQANSPTSGNQGLVRLDHSFNDTNRLNVRYFHNYNEGLDPLSSSSFAGYSPIQTSLREQVLTAEASHIFSPRLITELRVNYTRFNYLENNTSRSTMLDLGATDFVHAGGPATLPTININGFFNLGPGRDRQRLSEDFDVAANVSYQWGTHEIKAGFDLDHNRFLYRDNRNTGGTFKFDGSVTGNAFSDFLLGKAVSLSQSTPIGTDQRYLIPSFYIQDTFHATRTLTLSLGLRDEIYPPWKELRGSEVSFLPGQQSNIIPSAPPGLIYQGDTKYAYQGDYANWAPRIGMSWDVFGDGKTAVRAQYGIFYEALTAEQASGVLVPQPFGLNYTLNNPLALSAPYAGTVDPFPYSFNPSSARFVTPIQIPKEVTGSLRNPYTQNFGASIQRQLTNNLLLDVAYVGTIGRKLVILREVNPAVYGPGATTKNTSARRIYAPLFDSVGGLFSDGNSNYNSLQVTLTKRLEKGISFGLAYTYSKAIDEAVSGGNAFATVDQGGPQNPFNVAVDRSLSDFDTRHRLTASYLYELPFFHLHPWANRVFSGWELGGLLTLKSGSPVNLLTGTDNSLTGVGFDRPNVVGNPDDLPSRSKAATLAEYFDVSAFVPNTTGTYGNAGRNVIVGPGLFDWDVSLAKRLHITEKHTLQIRGDGFNVVNKANFSNPGSTVTSPTTFGRITSASNGRILQVSLKYFF
jgi:hypothetical protein